MITKLEVIRLNNKDVIATSCDNVWGVAFYYDYYYVQDGPTFYGCNGYKNGTDNTNKRNPGRFVELEDLTNKPEGYSGEGYYHIKSDGSIIEKCDFYRDFRNMSDRHNINVDD